MIKLTIETLPVELIADILGELDLKSLITLAEVSKRFRSIASDPSVNPWRRPILRALHSGDYGDTLKTLSVRSTVPRHNWIEILSLATPAFILYDATIPNLSSNEWEECFNRRFLPSWRKWKKEGTWKKAYFKLLHRISHRNETICTIDESWTKYVVLNRNGSANELENASRHFNPAAIFNEMKLQSNLTHLETRIRLVIDFMDVRILAFGTLNRPRSNLTFNPNAHILLHPPGVGPGCLDEASQRHSVFSLSSIVEDHGVYPMQSMSMPAYTYISTPETYTHPIHPLPALSHANYPYYTPGGGDKRWLGKGEVEEEGLRWVGSLMIIAQLVGPRTQDLSGDWPPLQDVDLVNGFGRSQYASFTFEDLWAIAPWMKERITKTIDGPGLVTWLLERTPARSASRGSPVEETLLVTPIYTPATSTATPIFFSISRIKPFTCGIDGCKAAFGDPSSRARHCKETHRIVGTYRCPVIHCKSSIKRRSAFTQHLKKHGIDPQSVDIDALAPPLLHRQAPYQLQRKSHRTSEGQFPTKAPAVESSMPLPLNLTYHEGAFYHEHNGSNGHVLHPVEQLLDGQGAPYAIDGDWPQGAIEMPVLPHSGIFTIDMPSQVPMLPTEGLLSFGLPSPLHPGVGCMGSPMSNPGLSFSNSPSPSPSRHNLLHPGMGVMDYASFSSHSTPSPPPLHHSSSLLLLSQPTYAVQNDEKSTTGWDFLSLLGNNEKFNGINV
ncbi:hypothetical protein H0H87_001692 [Tephrocybe sp. NHM501043]|nr:hypothetical protein H0H87_001692 [Tephrocybe sp. NHM501043]